MRPITQIIIHCSATPEGRDYTVADIDRWHRQRGFNSIGYHYVIYRDGTIHQGRPLSQAGAHCQGHNLHSIGICYIGGLTSDSRTPKDTRTPQQKAALHSLLTQLLQTYPNLTPSDIHGHNDFSYKACPCFHVPTDPSIPLTPP